MAKPKALGYINLPSIYPQLIKKPWSTRVMVVKVSKRLTYQNKDNITDVFRTVKIIDKFGSEALLLVFGLHVLNYYDSLLVAGNVLLL